MALNPSDLRARDSARRYTVTTSSAHNMPTSSSGVSERTLRADEIQANTRTTGNRGRIFALAGSSATTFNLLATNSRRLAARILPARWDDAVAPKIILNGIRTILQRAVRDVLRGTATVTVSPVFLAREYGGAYLVVRGCECIFSGVADSHYNGTFSINNFAPLDSA